MYNVPLRYENSKYNTYEKKEWVLYTLNKYMEGVVDTK